MIEVAVVTAGDGVLELVRRARERVVLAAPYVKLNTLRRLLDVLPHTVSECTCITRWLPEDVAAGVSDLGVLDDVAKLEGGRVLVHPHLHAKYYSNGQDAIVGSANLTAQGLGWRSPSNVELMVALPGDFPGLAGWEEKLLGSAVEATDGLRDEIRAQAERLGKQGRIIRPPEVGPEEMKEFGGSSGTAWLPTCPVPERLWEVYRGEGRDAMVTSAFEAAQTDLAALSLPQGLNKELFRVFVASVMKQIPLMTEIDKVAARGLTDTEARRFLAEYVSDKDEGDYTHTWRTITSWLLYFFPETYRVETRQEVLVKGRQIPQR